MLIRDLVDTDKTSSNRISAHPLQSYAWGEFRRQTGNEVITKGVFEKDKLVQSLQITLHQVPQLNWRIGYFPKGHLPDEAQMKALKQIGQENNLVMIKLEPNISKPADEPTNKGWQTIDSFLRQHGCRPGRRLFTQYSFLLDLTKTEDELLAKMHPKTRYNILLAKRKGVEIKFLEPIDLDSVWPLFTETAGRDGFRIHPKEHYINLLNLKGDGLKVFLAAAYFENQPLAANIMVDFNDTRTYLHGASSSLNRNLMAPYLLHWELMKEAKDNGLKFYDWWGITPNDDPKNPWAGITRFKKGFGGEVVSYPGTFDYVLNPFRYFIYKLTRKIVRIIR